MSKPPPLGLAVVLERSGATWVDAEVVGYDGSDIHLSPTTHPDASPPEVAVDATMAWTTERGLFRAAVLVKPSPDKWLVIIRGRVTRIQRREYVRLRMGTPMTLGHAQGTSRGTLIDLSEAALRARMDAHQTPRLEPGDTVRAGFTLHRTGFMLRGTVLRARAGAQPNTLDLVVMLDIPARTANELRRSVVYEKAEREAGGRPAQPKELP